MPGRPALGFVQIRSTDPPVTLLARLSDQRPNVDAGYGGWSEIARPRRSSLSIWVGSPALRMSLPIVFDNFRAGLSIERQISQLERLATPTASDGTPPRIRLVARGGHVPYQGRVWVVDSLTWGDATMNGSGNRTRQQVTLSLLEHVADVHVSELSPALRQQAKSKGPTTQIGAANKRVVASHGGGSTSAAPQSLDAPPSILLGPNMLADPGFGATWDPHPGVGNDPGYSFGTGWWGYKDGRQSQAQDSAVFDNFAPSVKIACLVAGTGIGVYNWEDGPPENPIRRVSVQPGSTYRARMRVLAPTGTPVYVWTGIYGVETFAIPQFFQTNIVPDGTWQTIEQTFTIEPFAEPLLATIGAYIDNSPIGAQFHVDNAELVELLPAPTHPTVPFGSGDDLLSIAARELGDASRWVEIAQLNGIRDPRAISPGQVIRLP